MPRKNTEPSYRWAAFAHWLNLGFLTVGGVAGAVFDPMIWVALVPIEMTMLWAVPDLPPFRKTVDRQHRAKQLLTERAFYLKQLWGLRDRPEPIRLGDRLLRLVVETDEDDLDERLIVSPHSKECHNYLEMSRIFNKLKEMVQVPGVNVTQRDVDRVEQVINGYLRILIACRPLERALDNMKPSELQAELDDVNRRIKDANRSLKPVLLERQRLLTAQIERLPKLEATLELFRARAQTIVFQLNNVHSQVLAEPGNTIQSMLDDIIERNDMMADPLSDLESDQIIRDFLDKQQPASTEQSTAVETESETAANQKRADRRKARQANS